MFGFNKKTIAVHNGDFHSDDVFACATLSLYFDINGVAYKIVRTRDENIISHADIVVDVGGEHDAGTGRFDHHQIEGAGTRENGISFASFGLVWQEYGKKLVSNIDVWKRIDERLVQPIDAGDNGTSTFELTSLGVRPYLVSDVIGLFTSSFSESQEVNDINFLEMVHFAKKILAREIKKTTEFVECISKVEKIYQETSDKRIVVLPESYPWQEVMHSHPEPLFVVYPRSDGNWNVKSVKKENIGFENRKNFPKAWAGLRDEELAKVSGVSDAVFCHTASFLCVAKSKEGAIKMATIAARD
jgi:uncharacterized UPF0160 family protein